jgi:hypothetical protein
MCRKQCIPAVGMPFANREGHNPSHLPHISSISTLNSAHHLKILMQKEALQILYVVDTGTLWALIMHSAVNWSSASIYATMISGCFY